MWLWTARLLAFELLQQAPRGRTRIELAS
jgi:hypothetical protein